MRKSIFLLAATVTLAGCSQASDQGAANAIANDTNTAAAAKHPTYCFFPDSATKGWAASTDAAGNVTVKGKVLAEDARYKGALGEPQVAGAEAKVWLTMAQNDTGFASVDNWWDVSAAIPNSASVANVVVMCGKKQVAALTVARKG